ncbi:MAG: hypothetical protein SRB2_02804 [Desulfobacteraceae bacterium Eth-SRB2]|nr:MAG: hypothetical protein SRB2_02804 [Desulfobacteraceae bacterium Eth-SRB2]
MVRKTSANETGRDDGCTLECRVHYQCVNCYPKLFGFRCQLIRFLLLKPDCKAFAQKMNKLMGENHFNKSVMLPECLVGAKRKSRYRGQCTPQGQYMSLLINGLFAQSLRYAQKIILGISTICLPVP